MEYTKEQIEEIIRKAFQSGENWGVTYSTWFTPSEQDTEKRIQDVIEMFFPK